MIHFDYILLSLKNNIIFMVFCDDETAYLTPKFITKKVKYHCIFINKK